MNKYKKEEDTELITHEEYVYKDYEWMTELCDIIEKNFENIPDKRTKIYKKWKTEINKLITQFNDTVKFKCFNFVK